MSARQDMVGLGELYARGGLRRAGTSATRQLFPTPPWATRALCEWLSRHDDLKGRTVWEPAAGRGDMVLALQEYFGNVIASDISPVHPPRRGLCTPIRQADFLRSHRPPPLEIWPDWMITNPPFTLAVDFLLHAQRLGLQRIALLVRLQWLEGAARHEQVFKRTPPQQVLIFSERVAMHEGKLSRRASTATAYCWVVWGLDGDGGGRPALDWLGPGTRERLERWGDYDDDTDAGAPAGDQMEEVGA